MQEQPQKPPLTKTRLWQHVAVVAFLALQLGMPLSYYMHDDIYDERFAWRMFSPIRMVKCQVAIAEGPPDNPVPLKLSRELALPWTNKALTEIQVLRSTAGAPIL